MRIHATLNWSIKASTQGMTRVCGELWVASLTYPRPTSRISPCTALCSPCKDFLEVELWLAQATSKWMDKKAQQNWLHLKPAQSTRRVHCNMQKVEQAQQNINFGCIRNSWLSSNMKRNYHLSNWLHRIRSRVLKELANITAWPVPSLKGHSNQSLPCYLLEWHAKGMVL